MTAGTEREKHDKIISTHQMRVTREIQELRSLSRRVCTLNSGNLCKDSQRFTHSQAHCLHELLLATKLSSFGLRTRRYLGLMVFLPRTNDYVCRPARATPTNSTRVP
eukprot:4312615-Pyramimonas_sp.AAC.1